VYFGAKKQACMQERKDDEMRQAGRISLHGSFVCGDCARRLNCKSRWKAGTKLVVRQD
jgi:hypothetical protein